MTVEQLANVCGFDIVTLPDGARDITGCYCGDLLSWVMGRANADCAWITIMSNINIVAVASLADTSCIVLSEGVTVDDEVRSAALTRGVNILKSSLPTYETAIEIGKNI